MIAIDDCDKCMQNTPATQRQYLGCGYEPRIDRVHLTVWQPPGGQRGYQGPPLTTCAGYTANLPDVIETAIARMHWKTGNLLAWCQGEQPSEELLNDIVLLDSECNALEGWLMTPAADGGGGK